jgi:hypothetical protein
MGEKAVEFKTSRSVKECGERFQSAITGGRGISSMVGGIHAKLMGGDGLSFYTPEDSSPFAALNDDRPAFTVGAAVPRANGAHLYGTNVHLYVWDRGGHREVVVAAHHSFGGGMHATKLMDAVRSEVEA